MKQVRRWDAGSVGTVERTDQGYLRAPATITKVGVFPYRQPGGDVRRELRLPDEVFSPQTIASFGLAPLTNGHPPVMLDARNTARYQVGSVAEPHQDGDHIAAYVQVTDADAIEAAEQGRRQLSCGYTCGLEMRQGTTQGIPGIADGLRFDAIQRNIRGNHVALVDKARAGSTVQLRLDGADGFQVDDEQPRLDQDPTTIQTLIFDPKKFSAEQAVAWAKEHGFAAPKGADATETSVRVRERDPGGFQAGSFRTIELRSGVQAVIGRPIKTDAADNEADRPLETKIMADAQVRIDGVTYDVTLQVAEAVGKLDARLSKLDADLAEAKKQLSAQQARADSAEESLAAEKQARADEALTPAKVREAVDARLALERAAAPILGSEMKLDAMTDDEIRRAVILELATDKDVAQKRLDAGDALYLAARYDAALEAYKPPEERNDALAAARQAGKDAATRTDSADDARKRMIQRNEKLGRDPLRAVN